MEEQIWTLQIRYGGGAEVVNDNLRVVHENNNKNWSGVN